MSHFRLDAQTVASWRGKALISSYDQPSDAWIFIALHDDSLGTAAGGLRMKRYRDPSEGLNDCLRLAEAMTLKWAILEMPIGGGKTVLALSRTLSDKERLELLERFASLLNSLNGAVATGQDLGTTLEDMRFLARLTRNVRGIDPSGMPVDAGRYTALGVLSGMKVALERRFGSASLTRRTVIVEGVGSVGTPLAVAIAREGANLVLADLQMKRAELLAQKLGAEVIAPGQVSETECDVYAPCAIGGTLNVATASKLRCSIVAGSANNQLKTPEVAKQLHARGILYAPDFVINAGGALSYGLIHQGIKDPQTISSRMENIGGILEKVFVEAATENILPYEAAVKRARRNLHREIAAD